MPYLVIKVEQCAHCGGTGYVRHPAWGRYWIEYVERFPGDEGLRRWLPDEEETCPDCEGLGSIRTEVPFEEALRECLPKALGEIEARERALIEAADADAMAAEWDAEWEAQ